jgi:nitrogen-specific signal transduction histidine kinase/CheY-like chemotaxis protein
VTYAEDGRPLQAIGITVDMTEQQAAEQERAALVEREQAARREAEAASRAKDEFLAMLGHELRNPLSAISSAVEVLNRGGANEALATNARNIIGRQTRHLARLMEDLLDVARVISGKVVLSRQPLELSALVQRLLSTLQLTGQTQQHDLQLQLQEGVWVDADATRIEQVVNNLLTNALKYTPEGRRIEVQLAREGAEAVLEVRDHGLGIPAALLPRIFDLFVQGERTLDRRAGGLGIGLTLVRRLVELHGGTVGVESSSEGSTFRVRLPAMEPPALQPVRGEQQRLAAQPRQVLLVEDNADAMSALRSLLELDGHTVSTAVDGVAGLAELLRMRPEVAVIDIGLPGLTGYEVAKRSRAAGHAGKLIALSGYGQGRDVQQALRAGFDAHLVKPVDPEALRRLLAEP